MLLPEIKAIKQRHLKTEYLNAGTPVTHAILVGRHNNVSTINLFKIRASGSDHITPVSYTHLSTINFLNPNASSGEEWHYRVFQKENPGKELGCTNQYGAIHDGRFFLIAKQAKDPGAKITGGRITVADAITMKMLFQSDVYKRQPTSSIMEL